MLVFMTEGSEVYYREKHKLLYVDFLCAPRSEPLKEVSQKIIGLVSELPVQALLINTSRISTIKLSDLLWISEHISPAIRKHQIKKIAFINPENQLGKISLKLMLKLSNSRMSQVFDDQKQAQEWVLEPAFC